MCVFADHLNNLLEKEDIEELISLGAPSDEYSKEAASIAASITKLQKDQRNEGAITAIIAMVWSQNFDKAPKDIEKRMEAFKRIAKKVMARA